MIYVNMTDKFMSGWGHAKGGYNYFCVKCDTRDQADAIVKAAEDRREMKRIDMSDAPRRSAGSHTSIRTFSELGGDWHKYYAKRERVTA